MDENNQTQTNQTSQAPVSVKGTLVQHLLMPSIWIGVGFALAKILSKKKDSLNVTANGNK